MAMDEKTLAEIDACVAESYARAQNGSGPITVAEVHRAVLVAEVGRLRNEIAAVSVGVVIVAGGYSPGAQRDYLLSLNRAIKTILGETK